MTARISSGSSFSSKERKGIPEKIPLWTELNFIRKIKERSEVEKDHKIENARLL